MILRRVGGPKPESLRIPPLDHPRTLRRPEGRRGVVVELRRCLVVTSHTSRPRGPWEVSTRL